MKAGSACVVGLIARTVVGALAGLTGRMAVSVLVGLTE
jgi:TctA family transporter